MELQFRNATKEDCATILFFIHQLADYEHMSDDVVATEELLNKWLFEEKKASVLLGSVEKEDGTKEDVGIALYFNNFSTFLGCPGIYLEDLFILEPHRGHGYGTKFLQKLASIAVENGYGRLEWSCLDWNKPSIDFYLSLDATPMDEWTVYRLTGESLRNMANKK